LIIIGLIFIEGSKFTQKCGRILGNDQKLKIVSEYETIVNNLGLLL